MLRLPNDLKEVVLQGVSSGEEAVEPWLPALPAAAGAARLMTRAPHTKVAAVYGRND